MSRILLCAIHSQYIHTSPALGSLSRYAGCRGLRMGLAEYNVNQPVDQILQDLYGKKPDILGFSCYLWNIGIVEGLVKELKLLLPSLKVFLGGPEVSFDPMDTLSRIPADYIVAGEGERRVYLLLRDLTEGKTPRKIDGVFSPSGGIWLLMRIRSSLWMRRLLPRLPTWPRILPESSIMNPAEAAPIGAVTVSPVYPMVCVQEAWTW